MLPSAGLGAGVLVAAGIALGILGWGGLHTAIAFTETLGFCTSCHSMSDTVYPEYLTSVHYKNASGVRAICSDCHVPRPWGPMILRKIQASGEIYSEIRGTISTPEKFDAQRLRLARSVWASMKATDSRECRNCHSFDAMDPHKQRPEAVTGMAKAAHDGSTCIDCHKGIAHKLPDMTQGYKAMFNDLTAASANLRPKVGDTLYTLTTRSLFLDRAAAASDASGDGKLLPGSAVQVIARDGDWLQVRIDGWQQEGAERAIYAAMGQRILTAALGGAAVTKVERQAGATDKNTDQVWNRASLTAWIGHDALVADQGQLTAYGAEMFADSCSTCHAPPQANQYLANQWIGTLNAMKRFINLDDEQYRFLQKYLQLHASDMVPPHG
ncbi:MAG: NapC/NirT family cytochrome c [Acetobacteraceae bacterium]|nr:NapC/NirT family cytochrome c [Acetobacteraceae bacterium]